MKTRRHTDHLVRLSRLGVVNAFLVVEDDGLTVVDTMLPRSQDGILAAARELGAPIARIALTHAHGDHVGSLDALPPPGRSLRAVAAAGGPGGVSVWAARPRPPPGTKPPPPGRPGSQPAGGPPGAKR